MPKGECYVILYAYSGRVRQVYDKHPRTIIAFLINPAEMRTGRRFAF